MTRILLACIVIAFGSRCPARAQQPFKTDDADVTDRGKFQLQVTNEFDTLHQSLFPHVRQNMADLTLNYGLIPDVEVGLESPLVALFNAAAAEPQKAVGIGDTSVAIKYNFSKEQKRSWRPALAVSVSVEFPTGDVRRQLGSGLTDYTLNGIFQKELFARTTLRTNTGIILAGDATTGVVGAKNKGTAFTGGLSLVRHFSGNLDLGFEAIGVTTNDPGINDQLQFQIGGNYNLHKNLSIDFGVSTGLDPASPRLGAQFGFSWTSN